MSHTDLKRQIRAAFADVPLPAPGQVTFVGSERISGDPEVAEFVSAFEGKEWKKLSVTTLSQHANQLPLFTDEALHYFLPAFLIASIENYGTAFMNIFHFTVYALSPFEPDGRVAPALVAKFRRFSKAQIKVVTAFLQFATSEIPVGFRLEIAMDALGKFWMQQSASSRLETTETPREGSHN